MQDEKQSWQIKFRNLLADIQKDKCVLLLGPELLNVNDQNLRATLRHHLLSYNSSDIAHYYERDGFFLFTDKIAKEDVQREINIFYDDLILSDINSLEGGKEEEKNGSSIVDSEMLIKILRLPIHLILSINPDKFLDELAFRHNIKHRFSWFVHGGNAVSDIEDPTGSIPLIYNLCGVVGHDKSLVLDYEDLFSLLSSLLGNPGLPPKLAVALQNAKHFLFLGFDFDRWYSQLLLRVLSGEKAIRKFAIDPIHKNVDTKTFLVKQFGIEFIDDESWFFNELFSQCAMKNLLRDISPSSNQHATKIKRMLQENKPEEALNYLNKVVAMEFENDVIQLISRFSNLKEKEEKKTIDYRDYIVEHNRIVDAILDIISKL